MSVKKPPLEYEIWMVPIKLGQADYPRPCIVFDASRDGADVWVYPLTTKDYARPGAEFKIDETHPDFARTGLKATSYTIQPTQRVPRTQLRHKMGRLTGELYREFKDWMGL